MLAAPDRGLAGAADMGARNEVRAKHQTGVADKGIAGWMLELVPAQERPSLRPRSRPDDEPGFTVVDHQTDGSRGSRSITSSSVLKASGRTGLRTGMTAPANTSGQVKGGMAGAEGTGG